MCEGDGMEEWKECKLGDLVTVKGGKRLPKGINLISTRNSHPYIRIRDLEKSKYLQLNSDYEYVDNETQKSISRYITNKGDVLISIVGTIGLIGIVGDSLDNANLTENCVKLIDLKNIDSNYLYYFLSSEIGQNEIKKGTVGAVQPKLPIKNIQDIDIPIPPLPTQQKIAAILSSLDDKIELNNKINTNLEQQTGAIFKNWFVDFEPFGGKMPEGWKIGKLCDIADYSSEKIEINKLTPETYYSTENMLPSKGGIETATSLPSISQTTRCLPGETIISNIRPYFKKILYCTEEVAGCSTDVLCFKPKNKDYSEYLYQVLYSDIFFDYMVLGSKGTKMPRGDKQQIMNYTIIIPDELYLYKYKTFAKPILSQIDTNRKENKRLSEIRDTLLPKLMNGEIEV